MDSIDSIIDSITRPIAAVVGGLVTLVSAGALTGSELFNVVWSSAGTWFPAIAVSTTTLVPNLEAVLSGDAATSTYVLVGAAGLYVAILGDRLADRLSKKWND